MRAYEFYSIKHLFQDKTKRKPDLPNFFNLAIKNFISPTIRKLIPKRGRKTIIHMTKHFSDTNELAELIKKYHIECLCMSLNNDQIALPFFFPNYPHLHSSGN